MGKTSIEWTDDTWNPVTGCRRVAAGCVNCYAEKLAGTRLRHHPRYAGLTQDGRWTGKVNLHPDLLDQPLRMRKGRKIFVCDMADLFHEDVTFEFIAAVYGVMAACPQHTFQVLTKRPARMLEFFAWMCSGDLRERSFAGAIMLAARKALHDNFINLRALRTVTLDHPFPLPNVWHGVSVAEQKDADKNIPILLQVPSAIRFVSAEPLIGPVDLSRAGLWLMKHWRDGDTLPAAPWCPSDPTKWWWERQGLRGPEQTMLDWVIVGGESGPGARPCDVAWIRSIVSQCKAAGVACFVKQLGSRPVESAAVGAKEVEQALPGGGHMRVIVGGVQVARRDWLRSSKGGDPSEWPEDLRVREFPVARAGAAT